MITNHIKETVLLSAIIALVAMGLLMPLAEPASVEAGTLSVTQSIASAISITTPTAVSLTPLSLTQQSAVGTSTMTVTTNDVNGYTLTLAASQVNAMYASSTVYFTDMGATPATWNVSNAYKFGFSVIGTGATGFGTGTYCGASANVPSTSLLWRGFNGTTPITAVTNTAPTTQSGITTTVCIADAQNGVYAPSGNYSATITATATTL